MSSTELIWYLVSSTELIWYLVSSTELMFLIFITPGITSGHIGKLGKQLEINKNLDFKETGHTMLLNDFF